MPTQDRSEPNGDATLLLAPGPAQFLYLLNKQTSYNKHTSHIPEGNVKSSTPVQHLKKI